MDILPQLLVNALIAGSIYAITSSGLSLTFGLLRILNFAHGHLMMVGAYLYYWASVEQGFGTISSAGLTLLGSIVLSSLALNLFVHPFLRFSSLLPLVATIALSSILEAAVSMIFGVNVKSLNPSFGVSSFEWGPIFITPIQILIIASSLGLVLCLAFVIHCTSFGRSLRALSENRFAAESLGVNYRRTYSIVFGIGTLLAVYAGIMVGLETNLQPTMGSSYTIKAFAAMILGGLGNVWGTIIGSYLLGLVENLSIGLDFWGYSLPAGYKDAFAFMIILCMLLMKPAGLFRRTQRKV